MKLVFCVFDYFPFGGLQRDMLKTAAKCLERGHAVQVLTMAWQGERPPGIEIREIAVHAFTNHGRCRRFSLAANRLIPRLGPDLVVGFNKMAGLDVYFAADPCFQARVLAEKPFIYRLTPRYRVYRQLEQAVFARESGTRILLLSPQEQNRYTACYGTPGTRFSLLPPGISKAFFRTAGQSRTRREVRAEWGIPGDHRLLLMVGSSFDTKGVDRSIRALASLPAPLAARTRLHIIGKGRSGPFQRLAGQLGVGKRVVFLGAREDVPRCLAAADLLVHPARSENTGTVLIEAMAAGLPVLATANCGYGFHVETAGAGRLVPTPFAQERLNQALAEMLADPNLPLLGDQGVAYTLTHDVTSLHERAVDLMEAAGAEKHSSARTKEGKAP